MKGWWGQEMPEETQKNKKATDEGISRDKKKRIS
jgi:hypothetical protein